MFARPEMQLTACYGALLTLKFLSDKNVDVKAIWIFCVQIPISFLMTFNSSLEIVFAKAISSITTKGQGLLSVVFIGSVVDNFKDVPYTSAVFCRESSYAIYSFGFGPFKAEIIKLDCFVFSIAFPESFHRLSCIQSIDNIFSMSSMSSSKARRIGQFVYLKPECVEDYKKCHAAVWPEVLKQIKDSNISDCMCHSCTCSLRQAKKSTEIRFNFLR